MARLNKTQAQAGGGEVVSLDEPLLDCVAAAALLNVRVSWVRDAARLGHLPCVRVGRHLRFTRVMLEDWLVVQLARTHAQRERESVQAQHPGGAVGELGGEAEWHCG
jgi:excisionase family DNA binding protein